MSTAAQPTGTPPAGGGTGAQTATQTVTPAAPARGVFWFGLFLGLLTACSTAAGTTVTLIGLLFTLVGGSFLAWYRPDTFQNDQQREHLIRIVGALGVGGVVGLLIGFAFQFSREYWITPAINNRQLELYTRYRDAGFTFSDMKAPEPMPGVRPGVFVTQASEADYQALARELDAEVKTNTQLTAEDKKVLSELAQDVNGLHGTFEKLKKLGTRDRLSTKAKANLDKVITASP
jgi:hypothetical protein